MMSQEHCGCELKPNPPFDGTVLSRAHCLYSGECAAHAETRTLLIDALRHARELLYDAPISAELLDLMDRFDALIGPDQESLT